MTNKTSRWELVLVAVVCTALGLGVGATRFGDRATDEQGHGHDHGGDHADEEHDDELSPATLANLGVTTAPLERREFVRTVPLAARVVATPEAHQPVHAPFGGRVSALRVERGDAVMPGDVVATILRDPIPRPTLELTGALLEPAQERLHDSVLELRVAAEDVRIARAELERVRPYTEGSDDAPPLLPRQRAIDLEYELARARKTYEKFEHELEKHGLTEEQIEDVERGAPLPAFDADAWRRALVKNGLWSDAAEALYEALPPELAAVPWATATIGELSAAGLATPALAEWVAASGAGPRFVDVGVLLLQGRTFDEVAALHALGALEPVIEVRAPGGAVDGWDVVAIAVKAGAHVEAGDELVGLHDAQRLALAVEPVGDEVTALVDAAARGARFGASPIVAGAGPTLEDLTVAYVEGDGGEHGLVLVDNRVTAETTSARGATRRTWALREGMRYVARLPVAVDEAAFVVSADALTTDGADTVVYVARDGGRIDAVPVHVVYRDRDVAVLGERSDLSPGDRVVQSGAFELGLALSGGDAADAHAGHDH